MRQLVDAILLTASYAVVQPERLPNAKQVFPLHGSEQYSYFSLEQEQQCLCGANHMIRTVYVRPSVCNLGSWVGLSDECHNLRTDAGSISEALALMGVYVD